jgi:trk system potassium uptake protein TrkH
MRLSQFIRPVDYTVVGGNLCMMLRLLFFILIAPTAVSLIAGEWGGAAIFGGLAAISYAFGLLGRSVRRLHTEGKEALTIVALTYLLYALIGGFAYLPVTDYANGFFESMSGFTTTGLSVVNPEQLPLGLLFFRSYSQWLGGAGIMILSLVTLSGPGRNAFRLYASEFGEENLLGDAKATARLVVVVYGTITIAAFLIYLLSGMGAFNSLLIAFTTVSTGGFSPFKGSLGSVGGAFPRIAIMVFMILGATSFTSYYLVRRRNLASFFKNIQLRMLLVVIAIASLIFIVTWDVRPSMFVAGVFHAATSLTTTGFSTVSPQSWPQTALFVSIVLMIIGGSSASTAGGIKLFRVAALFRTAQWRVTKAMLPEESRVALKVDGQAVSDDLLRGIYGMFSAYLIVLAASTFCFLLAGYGVTASLFETVSATGTVGLSMGITSPQLALPLKLVLIVDMWFGRLEILPVLVALNPLVWAFWRKST